jgi:hypothetical protein
LRRVTATWWVPALVTLSIGVAIIGCMDSAGQFSSIVVNDSGEELVIRYMPTDPGLDRRSVMVESYQGGQGLGDYFSAWRGGSITVLTADCRQLGIVPLDHPVSAVRISAALDVVEIRDDDVSALAKRTFLDEVSGDGACSNATSSSAN